MCRDNRSNGLIECSLLPCCGPERQGQLNDAAQKEGLANGQMSFLRPTFTRLKRAKNFAPPRQNNPVVENFPNTNNSVQKFDRLVKKPLKMRLIVPMRRKKHVLLLWEPRVYQASGRYGADRHLNLQPRVPIHHPLHHGSTDADGPSDLEDAVALGAQLTNAGFHRWLDGASAQLGPVGPGPREASIDALTDSPPLERPIQQIPSCFFGRQLAGEPTHLCCRSFAASGLWPHRQR